MNIKRRTQAERTAATREALIAAARPLFAERGFAEVATEDLVQAAGVTRGALYHHFADKTDLFAAVFETIEAELIERLNAAIAKGKPRDPVAAMRLGAAAWLDFCTDAEVRRIALVEAPAVLGWMRWRKIGDRYSLALVQGLLARAIEEGRIARQPVEPLAHVLLGAVRESALYLAEAPDRNKARKELGAVLDQLISALATKRKSG